MVNMSLAIQLQCLCVHVCIICNHMTSNISSPTYGGCVTTYMRMIPDKYGINHTHRIVLVLGGLFLHSIVCL
jgi:hypothetical protein